MSEHARLIVSVDSRQVVRARSEVDKLPASTRRAESAAASLTSSFRRLGGVLATYFSVREVLRSAEAYTTITNRLRLVTNGSEELAQAQADLFRIAQSGRQPLSETAELYQRIATNQKELGLTAAGVARVTETISKSLAVSGTSAASAAGALTQLGQAFASGQLRGEELNSVLENAPALAQALAEGLGVTVGQLRALGADGELTARKVVDALIKQSESMDEAFGKMAPTVSGAVTTVRNSLTQLIGRMDESSESSASAAKEIMELAELLSDPETIRSAQELAGGIATLTGWLVKAAGASADFARWFGEAMAAAFHGPALDDIVRVEDHIASLERQIISTQGVMAEEGTAGAWIQDLTGHSRRAREHLERLRAELEFYRAARDRFYENPPEGDKPPPTNGAPPLRTRGGAGGLTDPEDTKQLESTYKSMVSALERQRDLFGQTSEAARIRYEIENGSLKGIAAKQAQYLEGLAAELDMKRQLQEAEEAGERYRQTIGEIAMGSLGSSELDRLNETYFRRKEIIDNALEAEYLTQEQHNAAMVLLDQQTAAAREQVLRDYQLAQEQAAIQTMGSIVSITQTQIQQMQSLVDEGGAIGKAFFVMTQGLAAANSIIQGFQSAMAIRTAYAQLAAMTANPLTAAAGEVHASAALAMGFATAGMITAQTFAGAFDKGGTIPSGQWGIVGEYGPEIVRGPAMVTSRVDTARALSGNSTRDGGGKAPVINIRNEITIEAQPGASAEEAQRYGREFAGAADALIIARLERESRPGGLLWQMYGGGR